MFDSLNKQENQYTESADGGDCLKFYRAQLFKANDIVS